MLKEIKLFRQETEARQFTDEVHIELRRARKKFPGRQNVTFVALGEEVGELAKAMMEENADRVRKEAVQVAVMAMRIALDGDSSVNKLRRQRKLDRLAA
jgi:hypothetical protein